MQLSHLHMTPCSPPDGQSTGNPTAQGDMAVTPFLPYRCSVVQHTLSMANMSVCQRELCCKVLVTTVWLTHFIKNKVPEKAQHVLATQRFSMGDLHWEELTFLWNMNLAVHDKNLPKSAQLASFQKKKTKHKTTTTNNKDIKNILYRASVKRFAASWARTCLTPCLCQATAPAAWSHQLNAVQPKLGQGGEQKIY